jgi:hypothetical protein
MPLCVSKAVGTKYMHSRVQGYVIVGCKEGQSVAHTLPRRSVMMAYDADCVI